MKRNFFIFIFIVLAAAAEVSFLPNFFVDRTAPDLVFIAVIFLSIWKKFDKIWKWVIVSGLVLDTLTFGRAGANPLIFLVFSYPAGFFSKRFFTTQPALGFLVSAAFISLSTVFSSFFQDYFNLWLSGSRPEISLFARSFFGNDFFWIKIVNNLLAATIFYWPFRKIIGFFESREARIIVK